MFVETTNIGNNVTFFIQWKCVRSGNLYIKFQNTKQISNQKYLSWINIYIKEKKLLFYMFMCCIYKRIFIRLCNFKGLRYILFIALERFLKSHFNVNILCKYHLLWHHEMNETVKTENKRKICALCPYNLRRMTKTVCRILGKSICGEHKFEICASCIKK